VSPSSRAAEPATLANLQNAFHMPAGYSAEAAAQVNADEVRQRALELLLGWLSPSQREQFLREARFIATGSTSGKSYTVNTAAAYNVLDGEGWQFCTLLPAQIGFDDIIEDRMLAQKIAIETDEDGWLKTSNAVRVPVWNTVSDTPGTTPGTTSTPPAHNPETG
jgi:hypothetical protein